MPVVRRALLEPGFDPPEWTQSDDDVPGPARDDWSKVGGTPLFLQRPESPPGDGWSQVFQFSAAAMGIELADGAVCHDFVNCHGQAAFLWQCN